MKVLKKISYYGHQEITVLIDDETGNYKFKNEHGYFDSMYDAFDAEELWLKLMEDE